jgi:hypothetical protein
MIFSEKRCPLFGVNALEQIPVALTRRVMPGLVPGIHVFASGK